MEVLQLKHLQKVFFPGTNNERHVLKNINLKINDGDFISVIGNNGAGKSTLLNTIAGNLHVDAGEIDLVDHDVTKNQLLTVHVGCHESFKILKRERQEI